MKYTIVLAALACLCFTNLAGAQSLLEVGATWNYRLVKFADPATTIAFTISDSVEVAGRNALVLQREEETCDGRPLTDYIYKDQDKVYYLGVEDSSWHLLYDFTLGAGDTLRIDNWLHEQDSVNEPELIEYVIDSVSTIELAGRSLKRFETSTPGGSNSYIIEDVGDSTSFFYNVSGALCDGQFARGLQCFTSAEGVATPVNGGACRPFVSSVSELTVNASIYPNPFAEQISLTLDASVPQATIELRDAGGRVVRRWERGIFQGSALTLDVPQLSSGDYFLHVTDARGKSVASASVLRG